VHLHGKHLCPLHPTKKKKKKKTPNGTPKTLMSFNEQQKFMKGEKPRGRPKGNQVEH
jgi:hypothetical protein